MKTTFKLLLLLIMVLSITVSFAQNYKAPKIDASGKITDKEGKHIGSISKEGVVTDAKGTKVAYVDAEGTLVDGKTGKKLGKGEKNGNFRPYYIESPNEGWIVSAPMNGTCLVKDKDGNVMAEVHENYKQFGACAIHCFSNHMDHKNGMDKQEEHGKGNHKHTTANYACPMHPEVTSDKPGQCNKCGMDLVKKGK